MKRILGLIGAGGLALLAVTPTQADIVFATNPGGWVGGVSGDAIIGTPFTVGATPVSISALGYFDLTGFGLSYAHQVGIYDLGRNLLGSVTVPTGPDVAYHDGTRWVGLATTVALSANTGYMLAFTMQAGGDNALVSLPSSVTIDPRFALAGTGRTFENVNSLVFPVYPSSDGYYAFGGNMECAAVPEPSQWAAMGVTLLGLAGYGFRRYRLNRAA